jgi:hypothetical protein
MMDRKLHVDTLILIPTLKIYVFWYFGWTDGQTDRQTEKYTRCVWAGGTFFHCIRKVPPAHSHSASVLQELGW